MAAGTLERGPIAHAGPHADERDKSRIDQVYADQFRYVWRCLRALGLGQTQVDDAMHDVFLVVQEKLPSFDGENAKVTTWLYAIAVRVARRYRWAARKEAWRFPADVDTIDSDDHVLLSTPAAGNPEQTLEQGERLSLARRALDRLDDDKREAFVLSQVEQMSAPEIAEITGVPLNTVYSRVRAAKLAFQAEISRLELVNRGKSR
jgi:RNA polymerase sigma-70 factor, ECF subfamily